MLVLIINDIYMCSYGNGESGWGNWGSAQKKSVGETLTENLKTYKTYWQWINHSDGDDDCTILVKKHLT